MFPGRRDHSAVCPLPQAGVRDIWHPLLHARQTQRALPGRQGPAAEKTRHT